MEKYYVYMHINKINNKKYIGVTCQTPERRWREDGEGYKNCLYFYSAIKKYGWDNFEHLILNKGLTKAEAEKEEIRLIKHFNSASKEKGYNISNGGSLAGKHSKETRKIMSEKAKKREVDKNKILKMKEINKNRTYSETQKLNISKALIGRKLSEEHIKNIISSHLGLKLSEEHKNKISESVRKAKSSPSYKKKVSEEVKKRFENPVFRNDFRLKKLKTNKPVILTNTFERFENHLDAGDSYGIKSSKILKNCNNLSYSAGKDKNGNPLIWVFEKDFNKSIDYQLIYKNKIHQFKSNASNIRWENKK